MKKAYHRFVLPMIAMTMLLWSGSDLKAQDDAVDKLMEQGQQLLQVGDLKQAAEKFKAATEKDADNAMAWQMYGYAIHGAGDLDAAIKAHEKAATFDSTRGVAIYNLGCAYALKKDADKSFEYLTKAVEEGFDDVSHFKSDSDLASIRDDERYAALIAKMEGEEMPSEDKDDEKADDKKKKFSIEGVYEVTSGKRMGNDAESLPEEITVDDEVFNIPNPEGGQGFVMSYELDATKSPIEVDFQIEEGPAPDAKALGIIKTDDEGTMTLCYNPTGQSRPDEFESTGENMCHIFVMKKKVPKFDEKKFVGEWAYVSGSRAGVEVAKDRLADKVTITEKTITIPAGETKFVMSYKFDSSTSPVSVDMAILEGPAPEGSKALGIVKMEGDKLMMCYDSTGAKRPEKFETSVEDGFFMFELKKAVFD